MLELEVEIKGKTYDDLLNALDEVRSRIAEQYGSGFDSNDAGSYSFNVSGEESTGFDVGDRVMVASDNDNEGYNDFRDKVLVVISWIDETSGHPAFDVSMSGQRLYDLETEEGEIIHSALYDYELEEAE